MQAIEKSSISGTIICMAANISTRHYKYLQINAFTFNALKSEITENTASISDYYNINFFLLVNLIVLMYSIVYVNN